MIIIDKDIKPCPFCGNQKTYAGALRAMTFAGQCDNCGAHGPVFSYDMVEQRKTFVKSYKTLDELDAQLIQKSFEAWNAQSNVNQHE